MKTNRLFNVLLTLALVLVTLNQANLIGSKMDISEKLATNQPLDAQEQQKLRQLLNNLDAMSGWIGADGNPSLRNMYVQQSMFEVMPNGGSYYFETEDQTIATATSTPIHLTYWDNNHGSDWVALLDPDDDTKIIYNPSAKRNIILMTGTGFFESNTTGYRELFFRIYKISDDSLYGSVTLATVAALAGSRSTPMVFSYPRIVEDGYYARIEAYQDSGGNLDLISLRVAFLAIR